MIINRSNDQLEAFVNQALALSEQRGARKAAAYLTAHGAGFALTCRVLGEPARRRTKLRHSVRAVDREVNAAGMLGLLLDS